MADSLNALESAVIGVVVIGRNEGERLAKCLASVREAGCPIVYVDSGSTDDSVTVARSFGAQVVELDPARPFSAARARNEGHAHLLACGPAIRFVQFIDGDCTLIGGWLEAALSALEADPKRAAVTGHLYERNAAASPYNRLCALEWKSRPGDLQNFSGLIGIAAIRSDVLRELGGYNPQVIAGEDSELGVRMGLAGYKVTKLDRAMATHDANMTSFQQWWRRAVRAGHAIGQRAHLNGKSAFKDGMRERNSALFWGVGLPAVILTAAVPTHGLSLVLLAAYALLACRIWRGRRRQGDALGDAWLYTKFVLLAKFAHAVGLLKFFANRLKQRYEIIEYK
jgi:glycosyltransferase involved in cell wall biosynthesis